MYDTKSYYYNKDLMKLEKLLNLHFIFLCLIMKFQELWKKKSFKFLIDINNKKIIKEVNFEN